MIKLKLVIKNIMNMKDLFENNRTESIKSLQFFFFLREIYFSLVKKENSENQKIQEFIDVIGKNYYWESFKTRNYKMSLKDYVFWQSKEIYLENMKKFVSGKCSASDFACTVYFLIRNDNDEYQCLIEDFEKQATLELNPKTFQFSKIISDFELILESFCFNLITDITDDELRQIVKDTLPKVENYFTD